MDLIVVLAQERETWFEVCITSSYQAGVGLKYTNERVHNRTVDLAQIAIFPEFERSVWVI